jgi:HSP20 family protein
MANITRKDQNQPMRTRPSDPLRLVRDWMRWDPFGQMMPVQSAWNPQFEVRETGDSFLFKADLPGIKQENVDIQLHGNRLQITGHREDEHEEKEGDNIYAYERSFGSFSRAFTLPENADTDHVACDLKEGVLTLVIPKKKGAQPRKIQIGGGEKKS